ncbi:MAG: sulfotransferase domain-containing protein [Gammaproteobacteria bacterium]|jgi:hypothetical protein
MPTLRTRIHRGAERLGAKLFSDERRIRIERWLRGYLESRRLARADAVIVSFGKSGRTWLRVLLSRLYQRKFDLPTDALIEFDNLHRLNPAMPKIFFTHDNYLRDFTGDGASKRAYQGKRVILLARNPTDVAVSQYFQWLHRMRPHKMFLNRYPAPDSAITMYQFVAGKAAGIPKIVRYLNDWARALTELDASLLVRYEDMRVNTHAQLRRILEFMGTEATDEEIDDAVRYASFENMRKREAEATNASDRLVAADRENPDSYKSRRGKVGGYHDYFTEEEIDALESLQSSQLDPAYGYGSTAATTAQSMGE